MVLLAPGYGQPADPRPNSVPGNDASPVEFHRLDRDGDGRLSRAEFVSARPELKRWWRRTDRAEGEATERDMARPEMFDALDTDDDNHLSALELDRAQPAENTRGRLNRDGRDGDPGLHGPTGARPAPGRR